MTHSIKPVILALDVPTANEAVAMVRLLKNEISIFKVGMQLFYRYGPDIVRHIKDEGGEVFLDLKLHDIPNTVSNACKSILHLDVRFLTVHTSGGSAMLEAASSVLHGSKTFLIGVTVLTSLDIKDLQDVYPGIKLTPSELALHLAQLAAGAGLNGIVCSAQENSMMRQNLGNDFCLINPGIRPLGTNAHDQSRVLSPEEAIKTGGNYLVIGRPILQATDPRKTTVEILETIGYASGLSS